MSTPPPATPLRVCFICTGNVCRSPYAEGLLRHLAGERGWSGERLAVTSAGLLELHGRRAHPVMRALAAQRGFCLDAHRSRTLAEVELTRQDLILGMEPQHVHAVLAQAPELAPRTRLLTALVDCKNDAPSIPDPIGAPDELFSAVAAIIELALDPLWERLA